jgi:hypothetical protein
MSKLKFFFLFLLFGILVQCIFSFPVRSQTGSLGFIFIKPDGRIEPSTTPIQRIGAIFTFTGNIYDPIVLERDNVVLNGAGHYLQGNGTGTPLTQIDSHTGPTIYQVGRDNGIGINITSSNVTVTDVHIVNWVVGIDGAYDNNTIAGNSITNCEYGIKILGNNYTIIGNYIGTNTEGIRLSGSQTLIMRNNLTGNQIGLGIYYSNHTIVENNLANVKDDIDGQWSGGVVVYHNNFLNGDWGRHVFFDASHPGASPSAFWDHGYPSGGNYWSDYTGEDANGDGIGDTPYLLKSVFNYPNIPNMPLVSFFGQDAYPLMKPFLIPAYFLVLPSSNPLSTPTAILTPSLSPTPSVPEFPTWIILPALFAIASLATVAIRKKK